jgi:hypothetical protein
MSLAFCSAVIAFSKEALPPMWAILGLELDCLPKFPECRMITFERAKEIAQRKLLELASEVPQREFKILEDRILERSRGWMFPYNNKRFVETKNPLDGVVGNGPIFVDRADGSIHLLPSGGYHHWLEAYDRTGVPPSTTGEMRWISDGSAPQFPLPQVPKRRS